MNNKVQQLIDKLIEQRLDADEAQELSVALQRDPEAKEAYQKALSLHFELANMESPVRPFSIEELQAIQAVDKRFSSNLSDNGLADNEWQTSSAQQQTLNPAATESRKTPTSGIKKLRSVASILTIAASIFAVVWYVAVNDKNLWQADQFATSEQSETPGIALAKNVGTVAHIIKKIDCDLEDDRWGVARSPDIRAGQQINLTRGLLVLEFTSGVELTINGPASLIAVSDMSAKLLKGKLSASVPEQGRGFRVITHAGDFVDLGTEFGMIVSEDGAVEAHVFKGQVIAEPTLLSAIDQKTFVLEKGIAWARPASGGPGRRVKAAPERFMLPKITDSTIHPELPPVDQSLSLWFDASRRVQLDQKSHVSAWGDNLSETNTSSEDAWQVLPNKRPQWIAEGIGGKPTIHFDGYKSLVTEPITLGSNQTCAVVFQMDSEKASQLIDIRDEYKHLGSQLLNLNGPPHTVLQVNQDAHIEARVHFGWRRDQLKTVDHGVVHNEYSLEDDAHIAIYSYDTEESIARLYVDGTLVSESTSAPEVGDLTTPRYLGSHYERDGFGFTGNLSEILIFNSALTIKESQELSDWLSQKYDIPLSIEM